MGRPTEDDIADSRKIWRKRESIEDPEHASHYCPEGACGKYVGIAGMGRHRDMVHPDSNLVGPEKTVRRGKAQNMDDDRLLRRREFLTHHLRNGRSGNSDDSRLGFALKAAEMGQVENVLRDRNVLETSEQRIVMNPRQFGVG